MRKDKNVERLEGKLATISDGAHEIGAVKVCRLFMTMQRLHRWW